MFTDHKPIVGALARTSDPWTACQCCHLAYVAKFTSDVRHVAGQDNLVADALSRPPVATLVSPSSPRGASAASDLAGLAVRQSGCADTQQAQTSSSLQVRACELQGVRLLCDFSTGRPRPLVPREDRRQVFEAVHGVAHPGIRASRRMVAARFVWPGMKADIATWCRECEACQRAKITKQPRAPLQPIQIPSRRFSHVHVDLVGPLPALEDGFLYLFTVIDRTTRWLEATPLKEASAASCIGAFLSSWVARFGVPETVTTDRGAQFSSATWASFCRQAGLRHVMTTAYHPQANGLVERAHRQLKASFRARGAGTDWPAHLHWVLLGLHAAPKEISGVSSAEAVYGEQLTLPGDFNAGVESPPLAFKGELASSQPPPNCQPRTYAEVASQPPTSTLQTAGYVYVRRGGVPPPLAPPYTVVALTE